MLRAPHGLKPVRYPFVATPPLNQTAAMIRTECAKMVERAGIDHRCQVHH